MGDSQIDYLQRVDNNFLVVVVVMVKVLFRVDCLQTSLFSPTCS